MEADTTTSNMPQRRTHLDRDSEDSHAHLGPESASPHGHYLFAVQGLGDWRASPYPIPSRGHYDRLPVQVLTSVNSAPASHAVAVENHGGRVLGHRPDTLAHLVPPSQRAINDAFSAHGPPSQHPTNDMLAHHVPPGQRAINDASTAHTPPSQRAMSDPFAPYALNDMLTQGAAAASRLTPTAYASPLHYGTSSQRSHAGVLQASPQTPEHSNVAWTSPHNPGHVAHHLRRPSAPTYGLPQAPTFSPPLTDAGSDRSAGYPHATGTASMMAQVRSGRVHGGAIGQDLRDMRVVQPSRQNPFWTNLDRFNAVADASTAEEAPCAITTSPTTMPILGHLRPPLGADQRWTEDAGQPDIRERARPSRARR